MLSAYGGLNIGHAIVEAQFQIRFKCNCSGFMPCRAVHAHAVDTQEAKQLVPFFIVRCDHATVAGGDDLTGMKRKTGHIALGFSDFLPMIITHNFAADGTCGVFNDPQTLLFGKIRNRGHIAGHAHLVHTQDSPRRRSDGIFDEFRVDVECFLSGCPQKQAWRHNMRHC